VDGYLFSFVVDLSVIRLVHSDQDFDQGRFTGPVVTNEADDFIVSHFEVDPIQDLYLAEGLADVCHGDELLSILVISHLDPLLV